jgi:hypothetical protein
MGETQDFLYRAAEAPAGPNMEGPNVDANNTLATPVTLDGEVGTAEDLPPVREGDK